MRRTIPVILLATLLVTAVSDRAQQPAPPAIAPPATPQQQKTPEITTTVNLVDVLYTVLNRRNKLVPDLNEKRFQNLRRQRSAGHSLLQQAVRSPLRIGMLLDTSNSIRDRLKFEQEASNDFLYSVMRHGKDEAFVMTFDDEPQVLQGFTGDVGKLRDEIIKTRAGGGTAVYDAIYAACYKELSHPPRPPGDQPDVVRRVMILISDGEDNLSIIRAPMPSKWLSAPAL